MKCLSQLMAENSAVDEHWLAFFHEGGASFGEVCAIETRRHQLVAQRHIAQRLVFDEFAHNGFDGGDSHGRVGSDGLGILLHIGQHISFGHHSVDQAHGERFGRAKLPRRKKYFFRKRGAHHVNQFANAVVFIAKAQRQKYSYPKFYSNQIVASRLC